MRDLRQSISIIYFSAACISIVISLIIFSQTWVINNDAVCYLRTASALQQGLHSAMSICGQAKTPFYSLLIGFIGQISPISYLNSAYILNGLLSALTVLTFISIIKVISEDINQKNKVRLLWLSAFVILFSHEFNVVRSLVVRDHGYWAFYLLSVLFLIQHLRTERWIYATLWSLSMVVATLFRVEGLIFLILIPFCIFFYRQNSISLRIQSFLKLNLLTILVFSSVAIWFIVYPEELHYYKRLNELHYQLLHGIAFLTQRYYWQGNALIDHVLGHGTPYNGAYLLFITLSIWYVTLFIIHLSLIYSFLVGYAWWNKLLPKQFVLKCYILINVIITVVFLGENMFVSRRYLIALSLTCMFWIPFALNDMISKWKTRKWLSLVVVLCLLVSAVGGIIDFGHSKKYLYEAGHWIATSIPKNSSVYSNDFQLMFYSEHFDNNIFEKGKEYTDLGIKKLLRDDRWKQYDYLALKMTKKEMSRNAKAYKLLREWKPIRIFKNKRNDSVLIFETASLKDQKDLSPLLNISPKDTLNHL